MTHNTNVFSTVELTSGEPERAQQSLDESISCIDQYQRGGGMRYPLTFSLPIRRRTTSAKKKGKQKVKKAKQAVRSKGRGTRIGGSRRQSLTFSLIIRRRTSGVKRSTGHTHTHRQRTTPPTPKHTHTTRTTPQTYCRRRTTSAKKKGEKTVKKVKQVVAVKGRVTRKRGSFFFSFFFFFFLTIVSKLKLSLSLSGDALLVRRKRARRRPRILGGKHLIIIFGCKHIL